MMHVNMFEMGGGSGHVDWARDVLELFFDLFLLGSGELVLYDRGPWGRGCGIYLNDPCFDFSFFLLFLQFVIFNFESCLSICIEWILRNKVIICIRNGRLFI